VSILGAAKEKCVLDDRVKQETDVTVWSSQQCFFSSALCKNVNCRFVIGQSRSMATKMS
jgi:hypothetical protein